MLYFSRTFAILFLLLGVSGSFVSADPSSIFTEDEILWLRAHSEITLVINRNPPPISIWTDPALMKFGSEGNPSPPPPHERTGSIYPDTHPQIPLLQVGEEQQDFFQGVAADYLQEISAITGVNFAVTHVADNNFHAIEEALTEGTVGMMPTIMLGQHQPQDLLLTAPYLEVPVVVVMRQDAPHLEDITTLNTMRVAGVISIQPKVESLGLTVNVDHLAPREGLMGVATGKYDAFIGSLPLITHELQTRPITTIKISGELPSPSVFTMAISPHIQEFLPIINKAIKAIAPERKDEIWRKWFTVTYEKKWIASKWFKIVGALIALTFVCGLCGIIYYRRRLHKIHNAIASLDPHLLKVEIDDDITITEVTEALCTVTGFKAEYLLGKSFSVLGSPDFEESTPFAQLFELIDQGKSWKGEVQLRKKDGKSIWTDAVISPLRRKNEKVGGYTVIFQDASQRKHFETLATQDDLTGLYNRRYFNGFAPQLLKLARKKGHIFGMFLLDVDNFKKYNDHYGHPAGDKILSTLGSTLRRIFQRENDMSFRLGGEEFGVIILLNSPEDARAIAEKILKAIRDLDLEHALNSTGIITVSMGVCLSGALEDKDLESIYQGADLALYQAKENGRNQYIISR